MATATHINRSDPILRCIWARAEEKACRLALVYAASRNRGDMVIDPEAVRWACELSTYTTRKMVHAANHWVSESEFDARQKKVLRLLDENGGSMTKTQLNRKTRAWTVRERNETLDNMLKTKQVVEEVTPTATKTRKTYRLSAFGSQTPTDRIAE